MQWPHLEALHRPKFKLHSFKFGELSCSLLNFNIFFVELSVNSVNLLTSIDGRINLT